MAYDKYFKNWKHFYKHNWKVSFGQKGWLRPAVLGVLEKGPANGIEIINSINEMSHGWWKPSPGSIYPLLQSLCEEKIIKKRQNGKYEISTRYKSEFGLIDETEEIVSRIEGYVSYLEDLDKTNKRELGKYKKKIEDIIKRLSSLK